MNSLNDSGGGELTGQIVPFGKYKDRPVTDVLADEGYREWVLAQPWARERYPVFYNILIQGGPVPQDSPEHNEMQMRFQDEDWCLRLASYSQFSEGDHGLSHALDQIRAWGAANHTCGGDCGPAICRNLLIRPRFDPPQIPGLEFEFQGWDVFFTYKSCKIEFSWRCTCEKDSGHREDDGNLYPEYGPLTDRLWPGDESTWRVVRTRALVAPRESERNELAKSQAEMSRWPYWKHRELDHRDNSLTFGRSYWDGARIAVELKPDLGDDYPSVLRQVKSYLIQKFHAGHGQYQDVPTCDAAFLVARRARFTSVTLDQVRKFFAASGIRLVMESEIAGAAPWTL